MLRCSYADHEPREAVWGGVTLFPEVPDPIGTRFVRVVVVDLLPLDELEEDELPLDEDDPEEDWLPYPGDATIGCCTTGAGA